MILILETDRVITRLGDSCVQLPGQSFGVSDPQGGHRPPLQYADQGL